MKLYLSLKDVEGSIDLALLNGDPQTLQAITILRFCRDWVNLNHEVGKLEAEAHLAKEELAQQREDLDRQAQHIFLLNAEIDRLKKTTPVLLGQNIIADEKLHATRCCYLHGCKYMSLHCPVEQYLVEQTTRVSDAKAVSSERKGEEKIEV